MGVQYLIGDKIKELREKKGLTQKELAEEIGVAQSTVAMIESGKNKGSIETLSKIANYFNVSIDYLTTTEEKLSFAMDSLKKIHKLTKEGVYNEQKENKIETLAAHFEGEEFTDEDIEDIKKFINFILSKKKQQ